MKKRTSVYKQYLNERNKKIFGLRKQGKSLKWLAYEFNLSLRQISRILREK
ncbi:MAG: hypothetical protein J7J51_00740 [Candidatus Omnitrophica bacterium]|nr:hypothetical protein [Candidatus Omnitrophota bacterium]